MSTPWGEPTNLQSQLDGPQYLGPRTFMKVPSVSEPHELRAARPDVVVVGAPWDDSVANRPGARFGPSVVRTANYAPPLWHQDLQVAPFDVLKVLDYGDAACLPGMAEASHALIEDRVREIAAVGAVPVVIGGDHSITWPSATAVARECAPDRVGIVHFDAHADTAESVFGNLRSHGTPMRRLIESGAVPADRFVQIGLRGYWPSPEDLAWMREQGMTTHPMSEVRRRGIEDVVEESLALLADRADRIYLSVDIDVLDPGFAPGTGTPEPGGMTPADLLKAIRMVGLEAEIAGMDVVEVSPPYDVSELTSQNANRCILELLSAMARRNVDRSGVS